MKCEECGAIHDEKLCCSGCCLGIQTEDLKREIAQLKQVIERLKKLKDVYSAN
jgi:hypothetical protein